MIAAAAALRRALFVPLCLAFLAAFAGTVAAERRVLFTPLVADPDFDDAMQFFASYLDPAEYNTIETVRPSRAQRQLGTTLEHYLRAFILVGKGDLNDDGVEEIFYYSDDPDWCGTAGCATFLFQKRRNGALRLLCHFGSDKDHLWISDWVSPGGYREIIASFRIYWRKGQCHSDDHEIKHLNPPPLPPKWKPIK